MKAETLRDLTRDELDSKANELREQLLKLRFQQSTGQIEDPQRLRAVRKDIARVLTVRREKELGREVATGSPVAAAASTDTEDGTS